jgi:acetyl-CoA carboxylase carboxyl transferase subunit alpha
MAKPAAYTLEFERPLRELERHLEQLHQQSLENHLDLSSEISALEKMLEAAKQEIYAHLTPWQRVQIARHPKRPYSLDYINALFKGFQELHGDRQFHDDQALIGGPAFFGGQAVMLIAQQKGRETKEKVARNFGMPHPEGYRKALRLMKMADKFGLPVISIIDTPGAYPGIGAEERHVAEAIAVNLREMTMLRVPTIGIVVGEGGSGGALGIGVTDRVLILENSYYSVITPEGCAAILWKDGTAAGRAAEALRLNAQNLAEFKIVEEVIPEPLGGAHNDPGQTIAAVQAALHRHLRELQAFSVEELLNRRYERYRHLGLYEEAGVMKS